MKLDKPNYTQVPNSLLDSMSELTHPEFKLAMFICRQTFGWQRTKHNFSFSFIINGSGMARETVNNAVFGLLEKGVLCRKEAGNSFVYWLNIEGFEELAGSLANEPVEIGLAGEPICQTIGLSGEPKSVYLLDSKKERKKEVKEKPSRLSTEEFLKSLKANPAYAHINIDSEVVRARSWCEVHSRQCTQRFFINWLNRIEKPLGYSETPAKPTGTPILKKHIYTFTPETPPTREMCGGDWEMYYSDWKKWKDSL
jgi:phage replication O-like protein O